MLVFKIIVGITFLWTLYFVIKTLNEKVIHTFKYDFFDTGSFGIAFISNLFIYFGYMWYLEAIEKSGDIFNGGILIGIGIVGLLLLTFINIKRTNFIIGITGSVIQIALFGIASFFAFFLIFLAFAFMANTRPVYNIND